MLIADWQQEISVNFCRRNGGTENYKLFHDYFLKIFLAKTLLLETKFWFDFLFCIDFVDCDCVYYFTSNITFLRSSY